jgi:hypothetical protein
LPEVFWSFISKLVQTVWSDVLLTPELVTQLLHKMMFFLFLCSRHIKIPHPVVRRGCVRARVCVCVCARMWCVCMCVCKRTCVCVCMCAGVCVCYFMHRVIPKRVTKILVDDTPWPQISTCDWYVKINHVQYMTVVSVMSRSRTTWYFPMMWEE